MPRRATHPGGAAGLVRFMSCEDGRLKGPRGIALCHQRLASMLSANVVGAAAAPASAAGMNVQRNLYMDASTDTSDRGSHRGFHLHHQKPTICGSSQGMCGFLRAQWWFCLGVAL